MRRKTGKKIALGTVLASAAVALLLLGPARRSLASSDERDVARGKYLAEEIAKCTECHTPRDERGQLRREAWLQGAPIWIAPVRNIPNWADRAPAIAGLPGFSDEKALRVLEQGTGPEGEGLRPPMHIYHMKHEDAKAIVAYLKSLPSEVH